MDKKKTMKQKNKTNGRKEQKLVKPRLKKCRQIMLQTVTFDTFDKEKGYETIQSIDQSNERLFPIIERKLKLGTNGCNDIFFLLNLLPVKI